MLRGRDLALALPTSGKHVDSPLGRRPNGDGRRSGARRLGYRGPLTWNGESLRVRLRGRPALAASSTGAGPPELDLALARAARAGTAWALFTIDRLAAIVLVGAEGGELERQVETITQVGTQLGSQLVRGRVGSLFVRALPEHRFA